MENKLGRKSMQDWQKMTDALTARVYKSGFNAGYDAAKDETPDVDEMAELLIERYTDVELDTITALLNDVISHKVVKSANQQRAELIQRAREFVGEQFSGTGYLTGRKGYQSPSRFEALCDADFIVNQEKHTVVCLLRSQIGEEVTDKGIAKCMPGEVFNVDIGKAIALARALEIDVPKEFMQAVQPDEKVVGMIVEFEKTPVKLIKSDVFYIANWKIKGDADIGSIVSRDSIIIDDTNAQY